MCCSEMLNFAYLTSFYFFEVVRHLWTNSQKSKFFFGEKDSDCNNCKAIFKKKFLLDFGLFNVFLISSFNLKEKCKFLMVCYFLLLEKGS